MEAPRDPEIPITLDQLDDISRKNGRGEYDPGMDGLERIIKAARLAHYFKEKLDAARGHHEGTIALTFHDN